MPVNPDFRDLFSEFNGADVRFLVIGAHAVIYYEDSAPEAEKSASDDSAS